MRCVLIRRLTTLAFVADEQFGIKQLLPDRERTLAIQERGE